MTLIDLRSTAPPKLVEAATGGLSDARKPLPARRFRPDIQGLRAIAVLLVALYHAGLPGLPGGYVGVDVFFVISGFLITRGLVDEVDRTGRISLVRFYGRRMRRLLPPAILVVAVCAVVARLVLPYSQVVALLRDVRYTAAYAVNYHLAAQGVDYQQASAPPSPLQHFWSLSVEEQFYAAWPLLILVCAVLGRRRRRRSFMVVAITGLSLVTLWFSITQTAANTPMAYFGLQTRAWELGLGALVALSSPHLARLRRPAAALLSWAGLAMIGLSAALFTDRTLYPGSAALVPVAGAALVIAAGVHRVPGSAETIVLQRPTMQYVGKVSYAWYLWHWPMLILLPAWAGHDLDLAGRLEVVFLAFWFAVLTYFIEDASHRSSWSLGRWVPTGLALSAATVLVAVALASSLPDLVGRGPARTAVALAAPDLTVVQAALTRSMRIHALPRNLTPALADATTDLPPGSTRGCHAKLLDVEPATCTYGDPAASRVLVLVGDSHAQQWLSALHADARAEGWKVVTYTKAACPVAQITVWNNDLNRMYGECNTWRDAAFHQIRALQPDLIVASQSDAVPWDSVSDREWAEATVTALQGLTGGTARVAYIGDTPQTAADPITCLQKHVDDAEGCVYPRTSAYAFFPARHGALHGAVTAAGFGYVDPLGFFCGALCPAVVDNMVVRRDTGHVTDTYARWLAPMLSPIFEETAQ